MMQVVILVFPAKFYCCSQVCKVIFCLCAAVIQKNWTKHQRHFMSLKWMPSLRAWCWKLLSSVELLANSERRWHLFTCLQLVLVS